MTTNNLSKEALEQVAGSVDWQAVPSPSYVVDEALLERNLKLMKEVQDRTGAKILLAQKGFSMHATFPLIGQYLQGVTSSSLFEARLGREKMDKEVHIYAPAYVDAEFDDIMKYSDHIVFNTPDQWERFKDRVKSYDKPISCGLRINPEYSELETALYDPCAPFSRMGTTLENFDPSRLDGLDGIHFHTMCEQNSGTLARTVEVVNEKFGKYIEKMKWLNLGGGHHITRPDYDVEELITTINGIRERYNGIDVYLEPGEAVALHTGYLVVTVLDTMKNGMDIAIVDSSATCHMPDVLEMPYRAQIIGAGEPGELPYTYRLGGLTCLSGDIIGDYSFAEPLKPGDRLVFTDMGHYTMVKTHMFNGVNLPSIVLQTREGELKLIRQFGYEDFSERLS